MPAGTPASRTEIRLGCTCGSPSEDGSRKMAADSLAGPANHTRVAVPLCGVRRVCLVKNATADVEKDDGSPCDLRQRSPRAILPVRPAFHAPLTTSSQQARPLCSLCT